MGLKRDRKAYKYTDIGDIAPLSLGMDIFLDTFSSFSLVRPKCLKLLQFTAFTPSFFFSGESLNSSVQGPSPFRCHACFQLHNETVISQLR